MKKGFGFQKKAVKNLWFLLVLAFLLFSEGCKPPSQPKLQVFGDKVIYHKTVGNEQLADTFTALLPPFRFVDQNSDTISEENVAQKVFVADFFFTHCPSICPKMKAELLKINTAYGNRNDFAILSYSIDPLRDSVAVLRKYAEKLGISNANWHFLTGNKDSIYALADHYLAYAQEDPGAAGGFIHDGNFILVDKKRRIRGYYDGTTDEGTERLLQDIKTLFNE
ncbi:MAG: SCO family protein [Chitinophagales bacterium]